MRSTAPGIHRCPRHPSQQCVVGWPCEVCLWYDTGQHRATPWARWLDDGIKAERSMATMDGGTGRR
jgi:hypothetical protein